MTSKTAVPTTPAREHDTSGAVPQVHSRGRAAPAQEVIRSWAVWAAIAAALAGAIWIVVAGTTIEAGPVPSARANQAATDRLQGLAEHYDAIRTARANQAATDRLQGLAEHYDAIRTARANQAATGRLQGLADRGGGD